MRFLLFLPAIGYQLLACFAAVRQWRSGSAGNPSREKYTPPVSVLKPVRGLDPNTFDAFVSQAEQRYPQFEILFGVRDPGDPVVDQIHRLQKQCPHADIRLILTGTDTLNAKTGTLVELSAAAKYPVLVVNDGDIKVDPDYLTSVVAPLADPNVGVVTCPYRASAHSVPTGWEALGISADFMLSVFVARLLGIRDFGLGATLAFRAVDLQQIGGFSSFSNYIADDYQLAKRITGTGKRALISAYVVETSLGESTWRGVWAHQLRWARTVRTAKPGSYLNLPFAQAGLWILIACVLGASQTALVLLALRLASAYAGVLALRHRSAVQWAWLAPIWDLYAFAVWCGSYGGNQVRWRNRVLTLDRAGRILP